MGIFRTILGTFWIKENGQKICKRRFPLIINDLLSGLKTRVFRAERGVGGFQMLIFDSFVKIFPKNKRPKSVFQSALFVEIGVFFASNGK